MKSRTRIATGIITVLLAAVLAAVLATAASADDGKAGGGPQRVPTPSVSPVDGESPTGVWEEQSLTELAQSMGWPGTVSRDSSGRLSVQRIAWGGEAGLALVRPFDFEAGAQAAFSAEQEDATLGGYRVVTETFHTYPAYQAELVDSLGQVLERRYHWLAGRWILGAEVRGDPESWPEPREIGEQLLRIAVQHGLPSPPGYQPPTATATPERPPVPTPPSNNCGFTFPDVPSDYWAAGYITRLACTGVVSGYGDGTFRPQSLTTRGQMAKMVVLSQGWTVVRTTDPTFTDVPSSSAFFSYIETASARGVVSGYDDGTFDPYGFVTRAQVAKMVVRARNWLLDTHRPATLCDVPASHWAFAYVQTAIRRGVFTGYSDSCFRPDAYATRAQLAKVLVLSEP